MSARGMLFCCAIAAASLSFGAMPAAAEELHFKITSQRSEPVRIEFKSFTREHFWPGNGQSYRLDDNQTHSINIACWDSEYVCYGAWVEDDASVYWGIGYKSQHRCSHCCYNCDGSSPRISLGY